MKVVSGVERRGRKMGERGPGKKRSLLSDGSITPLRKIRILNLHLHRYRGFPRAGSVQHSHVGLNMMLEE